jgi:hypothetical protein
MNRIVSDRVLLRSSVVLLLGVACYFQARGISHLSLVPSLGASGDRMAHALAENSRPAPARTSSAPQKARASLPPAWLRRFAPSVSTLAVSEPEDTSRECDDFQVKIVTRAADPRFSLVTLRQDPGAPGRAYGEGDWVGKARIQSIGYDSVRLESRIVLEFDQGGTCRIADF